MTIKYLWNNLSVLLLCSLFLSSCTSAQVQKYTTVKKPDIKFSKYQVVSVTDKKVRLKLLFDANNPNDIAIDSFFLNYELFVNKKSFVKGLKVKLKLIPKGKSVVELPITVTYKNLISSVSSVAKLIVNGQRQLPVAANIEIFGKFKVVKFIEHDYRFQKKIDMKVPLPKYSMNDVMQFIQGIR